MSNLEKQNEYQKKKKNDYHHPIVKEEEEENKTGKQYLNIIILYIFCYVQRLDINGKEEQTNKKKTRSIGWLVGWIQALIYQLRLLAFIHSISIQISIIG